METEVKKCRICNERCPEGKTLVDGICRTCRRDYDWYEAALVKCYVKQNATPDERANIDQARMALLAESLDRMAKNAEPLNTAQRIEKGFILIKAVKTKVKGMGKSKKEEEEWAD